MSSLVDVGRLCLFCNTPADPHHIVFKSQGGGEPENIVPLCRRCHTAIHDKGLMLERRTEGQTTIYELIQPARADEGAVVVAERRVLEGFNTPEWFNRLLTHQGRLLEMASEVVYLDHEALTAAAAQVKEFDRKSSWWWQANILDAAIKRTPWGDKDALVGEIAAYMGLRKSTGWERLRTLHAFPDLSGRIENSMLSPSHFALAAHSPNPEAAIGQAEEKLAEKGRYPVAVMRHDLGLGPGHCPWWEAGACKRYELEE